METFNFIEPRKGNGTNFTKPYIPHPRMETGCQFSVQKFYKLKFYLSVSSVCVNVDPPLPHLYMYMYRNHPVAKKNFNKLKLSTDIWTFTSAFMYMFIINSSNTIVAMSSIILLGQ